jgi:hypothetical protein
VTYRGKFGNRSLQRIAIAIGLMAAMTAGGATPAQAAFSSTPDTLPAFNGTVRTVAYSGNKLYVGGDFTSVMVKGKIRTRNRLAAIDAKTGALLNWAPAADGRVKAIAVSGSSVYVAGDFGAVSGQRRDSLARLDATTGAVSGTFRHSIGGRPYAVAAGNGRLYVGGTITSVDGRARSRLAAFNLSSGALDNTWRPAADSQIEAITVGSGRVYVGGRFRRINNTSGYDRLVALEPSSGRIVTSFRPKSPVNTNAITVRGDRVYTANGGQGGTAAAYSTSGALKWTATFDGDAQAVAVYGDTVYVGGHFDKACRTARTGIQGVCLEGDDGRIKLAALSTATGNLRAWTADANGVEGVLTMAAGSGFIAVGGAFTTINGRIAKRLAQFS